MTDETSSTLVAPFTPEQVTYLIRWQTCPDVHPFTCPNRGDGHHPEEVLYGDHGVLRATVNGWVCAYCSYTQDWAHDFMTRAVPTGGPLERRLTGGSVIIAALREAIAGNLSRVTIAGETWVKEKIEPPAP